MINFQRKNKASEPVSSFPGRRKIVVIFIMACMATLVGRAVDLQVLNKQFLKDQGDMRHVSDVSVSAYRGMIKDRNGEPLAISTPVASIWMNPQEIELAKENEITQVEKLLNLPKGKVSELVKADSHRQFAYISRQISPPVADQVKALKLEGIYFER